MTNVTHGVFASTVSTCILEPMSNALAPATITHDSKIGPVTHYDETCTDLLADIDAGFGQCDEDVAGFLCFECVEVDTSPLWISGLGPGPTRTVADTRTVNIDDDRTATRSTGNAATEKQLAFIATLAAERGIADPFAHFLNTSTTAGSTPSKSDASHVITELKKLAPTTAPAPSEKQAAFIASLADERGIADPFAHFGLEVSKANASKVIDGLKAMPKADPAKADESKPSTGLDLSDLPSGTYGVPGFETRLKVRIRHGKDGTKWEGWTFVDDGAAYGNGTAYGRQAPGGTYKGDIADKLAAIIADPAEAARLYGELTGRCCMCARILEDEESVERGVGPICAAKSGWF